MKLDKSNKENNESIKNHNKESIQKIKKVMEKATEENVDKINWTNVWSKRYPVLKTYQDEVSVDFYATEIRKLLDSLKEKYNYSELDAMLVLKDILAKEWKKNK